MEYFRKDFHYEKFMDKNDQTPNSEGLIFDIDSFAIHDGPGIRMSVYFKGCPRK